MSTFHVGAFLFLGEPFANSLGHPRDVVFESFRKPGTT